MHLKLRLQGLHLSPAADYALFAFEYARLPVTRFRPPIYWC